MTDTLRFVSRWVAVRVESSRGASLVEYTLILSLIVLVALAGITAFGGTLNGSIDDSSNRIIVAGGG